VRLDSRPRQSTVKRHPAFCDYERAPTDDPLVEGLVKLRTLIGQNAFTHRDTGISQLHDAFAEVPRVYVSRADNYVSNTSVEYCIGARSSAPCGRTRLQSDVQRGACGHGRVEIAEALNLGMIATRFSMVAFRYYSIVYDQDRSNSRIRTRLAERLFCLVQGSAHELLVSFCRHCCER
jgi:hypothetical protein